MLLHFHAWEKANGQSPPQWVRASANPSKIAIIREYVHVTGKKYTVIGLAARSVLIYTDVPYDEFADKWNDLLDGGRSYRKSNTEEGSDVSSQPEDR